MASQKLWSDGIIAIGGPVTAGSMSLNAAANWLAFGGVTDSAKTINTLRIFLTKTGTLGVNDITVDIYSDASGVPNASVASTNTFSAAIANGWNTATGLSFAFNPHAQYWAVIKNVNGSPASNYITITYFSVGAPVALSSSVTWGWGKLGTVNSGGAWGTGNAASDGLGYRVGWSDGSYQGTPFSSGSGVAVSTTDIYAKRTSGTKFTAPTGASENIIGVKCWLRKAGTPGGDFKINAWKNNDAVVASQTVPVGNIGTTGAMGFVWFAAPIPVVGGDVIRFTGRSTIDSDNSSNVYRQYEVAVDSDANSLPLYGDWTPRATYTTDDSAGPPPTWTDLTTTICMIQPILQSGTPFHAGAGGLIVHPGMAGGMRG